MSYTLDKLKEARECLANCEIQGSRDILNELIAIKQRQWDEHRRIREIYNQQHNLSKEAENGNNGNSTERTEESPGIKRLARDLRL